MWQASPPSPSSFVVVKLLWEMAVFGEFPDHFSVRRYSDSPQPSTRRPLCVNNTVKMDVTSDARACPRVGARGDPATAEKQATGLKAEVGGPSLGRSLLGIK